MCVIFMASSPAWCHLCKAWDCWSWDCHSQWGASVVWVCVEGIMLDLCIQEAGDYLLERKGQAKENMASGDHQWLESDLAYDHGRYDKEPECVE